MDRTTVGVYEQEARRWQQERRPRVERAAAFGADVAALEVPGAIVDLGCGPGWYTDAIGPDAVAVDAAGAMLDLAAVHAPGHRRVQADLAHLPFRRGSLRAVFASKSYVHLARDEVPLALHDLHRALAVGATAELVLFAGDLEHGTFADDDFPGRRFSAWPASMLRDIVIGAGFEVTRFTEATRDEPGAEQVARLTRARTLADTVAAGMRLLVCGLNPSVYAADAGVGFARPGNRFWPAALAAGIVDRDRDPVRALVHCGVGMTDLVKRASPRADDLTRDEYRDGLGRVERLVTWLQPAAVVFVGLAGWRAAIDRRAVPGVQPLPLGGRPVYVMPNTSGVNARVSPDELAGHLRAAATLADA